MDIVVPGQAFQTRRQIDRIADHGVIHPVTRTHVARHHQSGMQAGAKLQLQRWLLVCVIATELDIHLLHRLLHRQQGAGRTQRIILVADRRTKQRHHRVTGKLVDHAAVRFYGRTDTLQTGIQHDQCL